MYGGGGDTTTSTIVKVEECFPVPPLYSPHDHHHVLLGEWNQQQQQLDASHDQLLINSSYLTPTPPNHNWDDFYYLPPPVLPCDNTNLPVLEFNDFDDICKEAGWWPEWDPNNNQNQQLLDDIVKDIRFPIHDAKPLNYVLGQQLHYHYNDNDRLQWINNESEASPEIIRQPQGVSSQRGQEDNGKSNKSCSITLQEIQKYFDVPITKAAKELNVGLTVLKKRCRELNIARWPHRKIKSLTSLIHNVKDMGLKKEIAMLEEHKRMLLEIPELELTEKAKKLRQACFKANYKKRKALAAPL